MWYLPNLMSLLCRGGNAARHDRRSRLVLLSVVNGRDVMPAVVFARMSAKLLHSLFGGFALFCLYWSFKLPDSPLVHRLLEHAALWGRLAATILFCQLRYLEGPKAGSGSLAMRPVIARYRRAIHRRQGPGR